MSEFLRAAVMLAFIVWSIHFFGDRLARTDRFKDHMERKYRRKADGDNRDE